MQLTMMTRRSSMVSNGSSSCEALDNSSQEDNVMDTTSSGTIISASNSSNTDQLRQNFEKSLMRNVTPPPPAQEETTTPEQKDTPAAEEEQKAVARGGVVVPFPWKLHEMLAKVEESSTEIVSWMPHGRAFEVHDPKTFVSEVMPLFFNQTKFASFQRQLNLYGFKRFTSGKDKGAYYHPYFVRGNRQLSKKMARTKIKGTRVRTSMRSGMEPDFYQEEYAYETLTSVQEESFKKNKRSYDETKKEASNISGSKNKKKKRHSKEDRDTTTKKSSNRNKIKQEQDIEASTTTTPSRKKKRRTSSSSSSNNKSATASPAATTSKLLLHIQHPPILGMGPKPMLPNLPSNTTATSSAPLLPPTAVPSTPPLGPETSSFTIHPVTPDYVKSSSGATRTTTVNDNDSAWELPMRQQQQVPQQDYDYTFHDDDAHTGDVVFFEGKPFRYLDHGYGVQKVLHRNYKSPPPPSLPFMLPPPRHKATV